MTPARERLVRQYVYDMINSFVEVATIGRHAYMEYDPPSVSFYSPDIELLLKKVCYNDLYSVKHPEFAMLHDPTNVIYDIKGHRVYTISGTVNIGINGVASDQTELNIINNTSIGSQKKHVFIPSNKFHVRLPK